MILCCRPSVVLCMPAKTRKPRIRDLPRLDPLDYWRLCSSQVTAVRDLPVRDERARRQKSFSFARQVANRPIASPGRIRLSVIHATSDDSISYARCSTIYLEVRRSQRRRCRRLRAFNRQTHKTPSSSSANRLPIKRNGMSNFRIPTRELSYFNFESRQNPVDDDKTTHTTWAHTD